VDGKRDGARKGRKAMLTPTVDNINRLLNLALEDPAGKAVLAKDWRVFMTTHFALDPEQRRNLETGGGIAADRVEAIQRAVTSVVEYGGAIRLSGGDPALLVVKSKKPEAPNGPDASCTIQIKTFVCHVEI
jgi:hypothetical protein